METPPYLKNPGTVSKETRSFPIFFPSCAQGNFRSAIFANPSRPLGATKSFAAEPNDMKGDPKKSEDHLVTRQAPKKWKHNLDLLFGPRMPLRDRKRQEKKKKMRAYSRTLLEHLRK